MSDDLGKKVQQIAQMLGQDNVPDNVKELVALIASSLDSKNSKGDGSSDNTSGPIGDDSSDRSVWQMGDGSSDRPGEHMGDSSPDRPARQMGDSSSEGDGSHLHRLPGDNSIGSDSTASANTPVMNAEMLDKAKNAIRQLNSTSDPRINLLNAIKPFMNNKRQKKIGSCIQLLQIAGLSRMLNEKEK